jgi:arsenate reductase
MTITLYGITNCDTVKKARTWLQSQGRDVRFHDLKKGGVPHDRLGAWIEAVGWERLLNRQGTTWRKLDVPLRESIVDAATAKVLMLAQPSVIKRPVVEWADGAITVGFDPIDWAARTT